MGCLDKADELVLETRVAGRLGRVAPQSPPQLGLSRGRSAAGFGEMPVLAVYATGACWPVVRRGGRERGNGTHLVT